MKNQKSTNSENLVAKFDAIVGNNNLKEVDVNLSISEDIQGGTKGVIRIGKLYVICWDKPKEAVQ